MIELPGLWSLSPLGALLGVIVLFYWMLAIGRIITRSSHERELALEQKRGDEWKETALSYLAVNTELLEQNRQLLEGSKIADHFFRSANPNVNEDTQPAGGTNVVV